MRRRPLPWLDQLWQLTMNLILSTRFPVLLTALLLALGLVTRAQAQPAGTIPVLENAYATLARADHDYKGHRAKAMKQIQLAVSELGGKSGGKGKGHEPQAASDAQLQSARGLLQQTLPSLTGKPHKHVSAAIREIDEALAIK